jgi:hypothetical protein
VDAVTQAVEAVTNNARNAAKEEKRNQPESALPKTSNYQPSALPHAFGDNATFVGKKIGHASALDMAALAFGVGAMFSFLQGSIVYETENLPVDGCTHSIEGLLPVLETVFPGLLATIRAKGYDNTQASLDVYAACPRELIKWCKTHGADHSFADPQLSLIDKAIKAGKGHAGFAYLYEIMKKSSDNFVTFYFENPNFA